MNSLQEWLKKRLKGNRIYKRLSRLGEKIYFPAVFSIFHRIDIRRHQFYLNWAFLPDDKGSDASSRNSQDAAFS